MLLIGLMASVATISFRSNSASGDITDATEEFLLAADHFKEVSIANGYPVGVLFEPPNWGDEDLDEPWRITWHKLIPMVLEPQVDSQLESGVGREDGSELLPVVPKVVDTWVAIEGLPDWRLSHQILLELKIDEELLEFEKEKPAVVIPQVVLFPTGEVTLFELVFTHADDSELLETVTLNEWGDVIWKERYEALKAIEEEL